VSPAKRRITTRARHLAAHFADAPVVIVVCLVPGRLTPVDLFAGASVYPAVQNLLLAARAIGLGATLTTLQALCRLDGDGTPGAHPELYAELKQLLELPDHVVPAALVPMGWPAESFGEGSRRPLREVVYQDRWGREWDAT
jgi:nitroreductase